MLLRNFGRYDVNDVEDNNSLGIIGRKRNIYVFLSNEEYNTGNWTHAKACIENIVVFDAKHSLSQALTIPGSRIIRSAVYFGDIYTTIPGNLREQYAMFVIDNVTSTEKTVLPNGEIVSFAPGTWSRRLHQMDDADLADFIGIAGYGCETISLSPEFYTDFHMNAMTGDFIDLRYDNNHKVTMNKLFDAHTSVIYMNILKYDTIRLDAFKLLPKVENVCKGSFDFSNGLKSAFNSFIGQGATFIYDSDALGYGKPGANVKGGIIPFGKQYTPKYLADNLNSAIDLFKSECHDIEERVGHVKVFYNPSAISDKFRITFKDYVKSPIIVPSQIENNGTVDEVMSNKNPVSSIDNGYTTDSYMKDTLNLQYQNQQDLFQQEMFMR